MKIRKLAILAALPFLCSCEPINRYLKIEDDAPIEEFGEAIIQVKTGIHGIDLTPTSPENKS